MQSMFQDILRGFLSLLDRMVYFLIDILMYLFDALAKIRIFSNESIAEVTNRIYAFIAIVMIFKVSFSIIQYIINPDNINDKERGFAKVIQNVILSLFAVVLTPYIFNFAYEVQDKITENNIVEKIILGLNQTDAEQQKNAKSALAFQIMQSFIKPNVSIPNGDFAYTNNTYTCKSRASSSVSPMYNADGSYNTDFGTCIYDHFADNNKTYTFDGEVVTGGVYNEAWKRNDYAMLLDWVDDRYKDNNSYYVFEYQFLISTAVGIFVVIMYLNFCIDLAIRASKFAFLQLISPIPIISMVDPKSAKGGTMSKWLKTCVSTYIGLFVRVAAVSFVIVVISMVLKPNVITTNNSDVNIWVKLVVILGALLFAKELPKLLSDIIGVNFGGDFKLNPLLRLPGGKMATRALTGTALAAGAVGGATLGVAGRGIVTGLATPGQALMHKIFPNRTASVGEMWSNAGNAMLDRLSIGGQRALRNLNSAIPRPFRNGPNGQGGNNTPINGPRKEFRQGERLYGNVQNAVTRATENARRNGIQDGSSEMQNIQEEAKLRTLYQHQQFRDLVRARDVAKQQMIDAQRNAARMEIVAKNGDPVAAEQYADAQQVARKAEKSFQTASGQIDKFKNIYARDYQNYIAYNDAKDRHELADLSPDTTSSVSNTMSESGIDYSSIDMGESSSVTPSSGIVTNGTSHTSVSSQSNNTTRTPSSGTTPSGIIIDGTSHTNISDLNNNNRR